MGGEEHCVCRDGYERNNANCEGDSHDPHLSSKIQNPHVLATSCSLDCRRREECAVVGGEEKCVCQDGYTKNEEPDDSGSNDDRCRGKPGPGLVSFPLPCRL